MASTTTPTPSVAEIEEQIRAIRSEMAELATMLRGAAESKTAEAGMAIQGQAEDLLKRGREIADGAAQRAKGVATTLEDQIAEKPVQSALIALLIGVVIGSFGRR